MSDKNSSFFDFDDDEIKTDIALSGDELFSIIDQTKDLKISEKDNFEYTDEKEAFNEHINADNEDFQDIIAVFSIDDLNLEYKKKSKLKYFIDEKPDNKSDFNFDSERNKLLDKFSEVKTNDILNDEEDLLIDDRLEIIEFDDKKQENSFKNINKDEKDIFDNNFQSLDKINFSEMKSIVKYFNELLDSLPEDKVEEFIKSDYYKLYKKINEQIKDLPEDNNY
ncbi:MAG: hypothetical protein ACK4YF_07190 [Exilispira sp.]